MLSVTKGRLGRRKSAVNNIVIFILLGALAYMFITGAVGKWTAQHIILPILHRLSTKGTPEPSGKPDDTVTRSIIIEPFNYYLLQSGAYETQKNAEIDAVKLKSRGGAGYIMKGTSYYHVFLSGYSKKADAERVQTQLKSSQNIDTSVYTLSAPGARIKLTATRSQADAAQEALDILSQSSLRLEQIYIKLDKGEATKEESKAALRTLSQEMKSIYSKLTKAAGTQPEDEVFSALVLLCRQEADATAGLSENMSDSDIDFSSLIKYNHIRAAIGYCELVNLLSDK